MAATHDWVCIFCASRPADLHDFRCGAKVELDVTCLTDWRWWSVLAARAAVGGQHAARCEMPRSPGAGTSVGVHRLDGSMDGCTSVQQSVSLETEVPARRSWPSEVLGVSGLGPDLASTGGPRHESHLNCLVTRLLGRWGPPPPTAIHHPPGAPSLSRPSLHAGNGTLPWLARVQQASHHGLHHHHHHHHLGERTPPGGTNPNGTRPNLRRLALP